MADFTRAIEIEPNDPYGVQWRADAALAKDNYEVAARDYDHLVRLTPNDPTAALRSGQMHFLRGDYERSAEVLGAALRQAPQNADLATWKFVALSRSGKDARVALEAALPAFDSTGWRKAVAEMVLGKRTFAQATAAAEAEARLSKPRLEEVYFVRAVELLVGGNRKEAEELLRSIMALGISASSYHRAAKAELARLGG